MSKVHYNVTATVPPIGNAVGYFLDCGLRPRIVEGSVAGTANIKFTSGMPNPERKLLKLFSDSGWGFTHEPLKSNGRGGFSNDAVFLMLVTL